MARDAFRFQPLFLFEEGGEAIGLGALHGFIILPSRVDERKNFFRPVPYTGARVALGTPAGSIRCGDQ